MKSHKKTNFILKKKNLIAFQSLIQVSYSALNDSCKYWLIIQEHLLKTLMALCKLKKVKFVET
jgi:hypothetical protein